MERGKNTVKEGRGPLRYAPELARAGYPVFPVNDKKEPTVEGGFYAGTTNHSQIDIWVQEGRGRHNVAFATGLPSGVVVVEADSSKAYAWMEECYGPPTVRTRRGGHWYFRHPKDGKVTSRALAELMPGLDRKADGGYVVVPPSRNRTWTNDMPEIASLPMLPTELRKENGSDVEQGPPKHSIERREAAANAIARWVFEIPHGRRHEHLRHTCAVLLRRGVPFADAENILTSAWTQIEDLAERAPHEVPNTLRTTARALSEGRATGAPSMEEITPGLYGELSKVFGWSVPVNLNGRKSTPQQGRRGTDHIGEAPDGATLLHELVEFIRRFVILREEQAQLIALWIIHTYAFDAAETTPYLHIKSAEKRSGKSRLLEVLELLAKDAWYTGRVTPAVLIRKIAAETPTLLLDESDAAFQASQEYSETLRGVLNAGFRRGGAASLCVGQGANIDYRDFPVYSPKAIAGIGRLPDTVADRSIPIDLKRRKKGESIQRFRRRKVETEALPLQEKVGAWVQTTGIEALASCEVDLPEALDDRAQDIVEPLLAIADVVGGVCPEAARSAAVELLTGEERDDQESLGVRLLADIKAVFEAEEEETVRTSSVVAGLRYMAEAPWDDFKGSGLTAQRMAQLLKPYGVKSKKIWDKNVDKAYQGFERGQF